MPSVDLPIDALRSYRPLLEPPPDLDSLWSETLGHARDTARPPRTGAPLDTGLVGVEVRDVTFSGFDGHAVKAWYVRPAARTEELPLVVEYLGYGGGRGLPHEWLLWANAGYAHLVMDTRGQGSSWGSGGHTPDPADDGAPAHPGFLTRGVLDVRTSYLRRLVTDAVLAVDAGRLLPGVAADAVLVSGASQGGGLALAAAGLADGVAGALVDVPFLCHIRRGVELSPTDPYAEVARYLAVHREHVDAVFRTLAYVDGVHLGARATAPALFSVALLDAVCPPSTVFAAFHAYGGPASIEVYPFNGHEGGQAHHTARRLTWVHDLLSTD